MVSRSKLKKLRGPPPDEPWVWITRGMLESEAWQAMPLNARKVVERIACEHMNHAGTQNGELIVTYDDFERFGIRRGSIAEAIRIAEALGFIDVVERGRRSHGIARRPSIYALTWLPRCDFTPASNRWKSVKTAERAAIVIESAKRRPLTQDIKSRDSFVTEVDRQESGNLQ